MSSLLSKIKTVVENIPEPISNKLVYIPFGWRFGSSYSDAKNHINSFDCLSTSDKKKNIFNKTKWIVEYAINNTEFYRDFYSKNKFSFSELKKFDDIQRIPILTKQDLKDYALEKRSCLTKGGLKINTGGTSGEPLEFYIDNNAFAREWAHMHYIWETVGYKITDIKLTFRGKNLGDQALKYNAVHNEYIVNAYCEQSKVADEIIKLLARRKVLFLHGYPSAIYNFAEYCKVYNPELASKLAASLKAIFFGSEYPAPKYRAVIDETFKVKSLSWYGHSEMSVLAYEAVEPFNYFPLQTYGYCEAIKFSSEGERLIGSSYQNIASPFIRYDTGDLVTADYDEGLLQSFVVKAGRTGEFIVDQKGLRITLTALIFGRHHEAFDIAKFIQISQSQPGDAIVYIVPRSGSFSSEQWRTLFDMTNVDMNFEFVELNEPIRTDAGKVMLLV